MTLTQRQAAGAVAAVLAGRSLDQALPAESGAAARDLAYGTLRHLGYLDFALRGLLRKPLQDPFLQALLLCALYQLEHGRGAPHAVVDSAVALAGQAVGASTRGLVNAVLRHYQRRRDELLAAAPADPVAQFQHPRWWIDRLRAQYPDAWQDILTAGNRHAPMTLRVNRRVLSADDYLARLGERGIAATSLGGEAVRLDEPRPVGELPGFTEGWASVQDLGAQYAAGFLDPPPGGRVLDAASAPGGKAAHLLETAELPLTCVDVSAKRLRRVASTLERLHLSAELVCGDAADPAAWWDGQAFDRALADVPCSGSGVVARHPDIKWLRRESDLAQFAARQGAILDGVWQCLVPGGKLLYVTCSVFWEENAAVIGEFIARHADARAEVLIPPAAPPDGGPVSPPGGVGVQWLPTRDHDGFYYALLGKTRP